MGNTIVKFKNKETKENIYPKTVIDSIDGFIYDSSISAYMSSNKISLNNSSFLISNSSLTTDKNITFGVWQKLVEKKLSIL